MRQIVENPNIERLGEHPTVVRWKKTVGGDVGDTGDRQEDTPQKEKEKNNDENFKNLQEMKEKNL